MKRNFQTLQPGWYVRRDGALVDVLLIEGTKQTFCAAGTVYTTTGDANFDTGTVSGLDLITRIKPPEVIPEPQVVTVERVKWMNIIKDSNGPCPGVYFYETEEGAKRGLGTSKALLATVEVRWQETVEVSE